MKMHSILDKIIKYTGFLKGSYSQEGEDKILETFFKKKNKGFYVDVGAHHPLRFSNTHLFYKKGWHGINIDANPGSMKLFEKYRPRDINIEVPISNNNKKINYYIFNEPALNSFSSTLSKDRDANTKYRIKKVIKLSPKKLSQILDENLPSNVKIDFMSIDVEGYEYEALTSNNWVKYKPTYLLVEILQNNLNQTSENKIYAFLKNKNYKKIKAVGRTIIFRKKQ
jgi:FkbM family methyltransferase